MQKILFKRWRQSNTGVKYLFNNDRGRDIIINHLHPGKMIHSLIMQQKRDNELRLKEIQAEIL